MIYPNVPPEVWAKRHRLSLTPRACPECKVSLSPSIPFATLEYRGLKSEPHGCGPCFDLKRFRAVKGPMKDEWPSLYRDCAGAAERGGSDE